MIQMKSSFSRYSLNVFLKSFRLANRAHAAHPATAAKTAPESLPASPPR